MRLSIRWKLVLWSVLPVSIVVVAAALPAWHWLRDVSARAQVAAMAGRVALHASRLDARLALAAQVARGAALAVAMDSRMDRAALNALQVRAVGRNASILGCAVMLSSVSEVAYVRRRAGGVRRFEVLSGAAARDGARVPWLGQVAEASVARWSEPHPSAERSSMVVTHAVPLLRDGRSLGALAVDVSLAGVLPASGPETRLDEDLAVLDASGRVLAQRRGAAPFEWMPASFDESLRRYVMGRLAGERRARPGAVARTGTLSVTAPSRVAWSTIPSVSWVLVSALPESRVLAFTDAWLARGAAATVLVLALLALLIFAAGTTLTARLRQLADAVNQLGRGDFFARAPVLDARDEIGELARAFNAMVDELRVRVEESTRETAARELVEGELRAARKIQASLLPRVFPTQAAHPEIELYGVNAAARYVGGDFYDCFFTSPTELALIIADVSGKGIPAAMLMAVSRTMAHNLAMDGLSPAEILAEINRLLLENSIGSMYVTLFVARYDKTTGVFSYANGAHLPPLVVGDDNVVRSVGEATGTVVGILPESTYTQATHRLAVGELLVMYTDGVTEARSPTGEFYGDRPLKRLLLAYADAPPHFLCNLIVREVNAFQGGERTDDLTLLMLRRLA